VIAARSAGVAALAIITGCSASAEPAECVAKIAELERERADYVERTIARLKQPEPNPEGATLENQAKFADFMTEIEFRENRIKVERLRCPEVLPKVDPNTPVPVARRRTDAADQ
jgi:hypothetical protein